MVFNSMQYVVFFVLIVFVYYSLPHKYRWILLLLGSYYFYMCWKAEYLILILISTTIDYVCGLKIYYTESRIRKRIFLLFSLFTNLGLLCAFKYFNFFNDSLRELFNSFNIAYHIPQLRVLLPVGISFYTFQTLSYTIDIYRDNLKPEKHFGIFALFVTFFPQLVAGPVERAVNLIPRLKRKNYINYERITDGLRLIMWGFFKKVVVADNIAFYVDQVYNNCYDYKGWALIFATIFFLFQIYCDFSAYSDIAIGSAKILGYDLMINFRFPLFARSIPDFWRRWHISMSTWFRDYLYIPLGGNRCKKSRLYLNIFIVFFLSGLWHGANWTFVMWGMIHGVYMICSIVTKPIRKKILDILKINPRFHHIIQIIITFNLASFSKVFFRGNSIRDSLYIFKHLFSNLGDFSGLTVSLGRYQIIIMLISIAILLLVEIIQINYSIKKLIMAMPISLRWLLYFLLIFIIIIFGVDANSQFIYFQF